MIGLRSTNVNCAVSTSNGFPMKVETFWNSHLFQNNWLNLDLNLTIGLKWVQKLVMVMKTRKKMGPNSPEIPPNYTMNNSMEDLKVGQKVGVYFDHGNTWFIGQIKSIHKVRDCFVGFELLPQIELQLLSCQQWQGITIRTEWNILEHHIYLRAYFTPFHVSIPKNFAMYDPAF